MRSSFRPAGAALIPLNTGKMKCLNLNDNQNYWDSFWGVNWNATFLDTLMAKTHYFGFNAVKVYFDGLASGNFGGNGPNAGTGYPSVQILQQRLATFDGLLRKYGLGVYLALNQSIDFAASTTAATQANIATEAQFVAMFVSYCGDRLLAIDLCNEMNGGGRNNVWGTSGTYGAGSPPTRAPTDLAALKAAIRAVAPAVPLTSSVYMNSQNDFTNNGWLDLQYSLGLDFHDYHPYFGFGGVAPSAANCAALEARDLFIGKHLCGECGYGLDASQGKPAGTQTAFVAGMGASAQRTTSLGAVYFHSVPYYQNGSINQPTADDPYGYALFASDLSLTNMAIVAGLASWPGGQI